MLVYFGSVSLSANFNLKFQPALLDFPFSAQDSSLICLCVGRSGLEILSK